MGIEKKGGGVMTLRPMLEAGTCGDDKVWIGAPVECYDYAKKPLSGSEIHMLIFTVPQATAVVEMLQGEIDRVTGSSQPATLEAARIVNDWMARDPAARSLYACADSVCLYDRKGKPQPFDGFVAAAKWIRDNKGAT